MMRTSDGELEFYAFVRGGERQARCDIRAVSTEESAHRSRRYSQGERECMYARSVALCAVSVCTVFPRTPFG